MRRFLISAGLVAVFLGTSFFGGSNLQAQVPGAERIEAVVNETVITRFDVEKKITRAGVKLEDLSVSDRKAVYRQSLISLLTEAISEQAAKKSGLTISEEQFMNRRQERIRKQFKTESAFKKYLTNAGRSEQEWNRELRTEFETNAWIQVVAGASGAKNLKARPQADITVTPRELRAYYRKHKAEKYTRKNRRKLRVLQLKYKRRNPQDRIRALGEMNVIRQKLETKADFAVLAEKHSVAPSAEKGGDIDWIEKDSDKIPESLVEAVFEDGVKTGDVVGPVRFVNGLWLAKVEEMESARTVSFRDAQKRIEIDLRREKFSRALFRVQLRLIEEAYIFPRRLKRELIDSYRAQVLR